MFRNLRCKENFERICQKNWKFWKNCEIWECELRIVVPKMTVYFQNSHWVRLKIPKFFEIILFQKYKNIKTDPAQVTWVLKGQKIGQKGQKIPWCHYTKMSKKTSELLKSGNFSDIFWPDRSGPDPIHSPSFLEPSRSQSFLNVTLKLTVIPCDSYEY